MASIETFALVSAAVFGLLVGSFLNVVIHRLPRRGETKATGSRSRCPECGALIAWYDNVPLFSWLALRGRCRACRTPISPRYLLVEALTGALFAAVAWRFVIEPGLVLDPVAWGAAVARAAFVSALVAATFIDLDFRIIPDAITIPGMMIAPIAVLLFPRLLDAPRADEGLYRSLVGVAVGAGVILAVGWLGKLLFKKDAMGFGDVKYMGLIGGFLGWQGALLTFLVSCFAGSIIGVAVLVIKKSHYIPFAPFLSIGALAALFFRAEILTFVFDTYPGLFRG